MQQTSEASARNAPCPIRVVLLARTELNFRESELPFNVHRCKEHPSLPDLSDGFQFNVLFIDLAELPMSETVRLIARLEQLDNIFAIAVGGEKPFGCEQVLRMGFSGLLRGDESVITVVRAIEAVVAGQLWFPREIISRVLKALLSESAKRQLKSRELQILALIGAGLNNQEIADRLFISRETVRWHVRGLYSKLGIKDRESARAYYRSTQTVGKAKPVRQEVAIERHSETAS